MVHIILAHTFWQITFSANTYFFTMPEGIQKGPVILRPFSLSKNPGADKGPQPLMFNPALTTQGELPRRGKRRPPRGCASERMKTLVVSYFAGFAARRPAATGQFRPVSRGGTSCFLREAKPVKLKKVAFSHFFDTLKGTARAVPFFVPQRWPKGRFCEALHLDL